MSLILGIDVGATGIKGAVVDVKQGVLISERFKLLTPKSGRPTEMIKVINEIVKHFKWKGKPIGLGFPAIIKNNRACSAANIHKSWIGFNIKKQVEEATHCPVAVINDADAAGIAEMKFGRGKKVNGTVILLTLGTGIGSAVFLNGALLPNTEFGHLKFKKGIAENYASNSARKIKDLEWKEFGEELNDFLKHIDFIFSPNLILIGGGVSKKFDCYSKYILKSLNVMPAETYNNAGIIGAAMAYKLYHVE